MLETLRSLHPPQEGGGIMELLTQSLDIMQPLDRSYQLPMS